jgi:hypothetical protein
MRTKAFISYSHADIEWLKRLHVHLTPLIRDQNIDVWDDTQIGTGKKWFDEIGKALDAAKVAILLISADFLASDFIANVELPALLQAAEKDGAIILGVILSPSRFLKTPLSQFQTINDPQRPLINLSKGEQEEVLVKLSYAVEDALKKAIVPEAKVVEEASALPVIVSTMTSVATIKVKSDEDDLYLERDLRRAKIAVDQTAIFDDKLRQAKPGANYYSQISNQREIQRILSVIGKDYLDYELCWMRGLKWSQVQKFEKLADDIWLIGNWECRIKELWIHRNSTLDRQYIALHLAPMPSFGFYDKERDYESVGYFQGNYIDPDEFSDGYTVKGDETVEIVGGEWRHRNLEDDFMFLVPKFSVLMQAKQVQTRDIYLSIKKAGAITQELLGPIEELEKPFWMTLLD